MSGMSPESRYSSIACRWWESPVVGVRIVTLSPLAACFAMVPPA